MDERAQNQRIREHLWHRLESEHRQLEKVLTDVQSLAADASFETARRRFGEFRLAHERHLVSERRMESLCAGSPEMRSFVARVQRERARVLEQSERVWKRLCQERNGHLPRMLARLASLIAQHEDAQRRLILAELPLSPELRRSQASLLRKIGTI